MRSIKVLVSAISHTPLWYVWRESGVAAKHDIDLELDVAGWALDGKPARPMKERASSLLAGDYQFLSGLHHEPYAYRARGDKRLVFLAQAQNDWDDRVVVSDAIDHVTDLEGKALFVTSSAPCVRGNLISVIAKAGADPEKIEFRPTPRPPDFRQRLQDVADGLAAGAQIDIPFDRIAREYGLKVLPLPQIPVVHNVTLCGNRDWLDDNRELAVDFLKSMVDAIHFFKTRPDEVRAILARTVCPLLDIRTDEDTAHLADEWAELLSPKPIPHPLAVWNLYALDVAKDPAMNHVDALEPWDLSLVQSIERSGYIDALYGTPVRNAAVAPLISG